jgi:CRP-like cAMP-binding protein/rhodanese-related sulfurtransferase
VSEERFEIESHLIYIKGARKWGMGKNEIVEALTKSSLFGSLPPEALEDIAAIAREVTLPADTVLGRAGDTGKACCIVVSGKVKLFRTGKGGVEIEIIRLGPGESFGEVFLLSHETIPASVKTVEEARLIVIPGEPFAPIMKKYPEVSAAVGKGVSRWLHRVSSGIESRANRLLEASRLKWLDFVPIIGLSLLCAIAFNFSNPKGIPLIPKSFSSEDVAFISSSAAYQKYQRGEILIVDAMPSTFYEEEHIDKAVSLPLAIFDFMYDLKLGKINKDKEIIVYGRTISKHYDEEVAAKLVVRGFNNVKILKGGLAAWKKNHYPVVS